MNQLTGLGRIVFAIAMIGFGVLSLVYADPVFGLAAPLPAWLPLHAFWGYLTGSVLVVAGGCLLGGVKVRAAALVLGILFSLWVLLLHVPELIANPHSGNAWTTAPETLAICSAAWILTVTHAAASRAEAILAGAAPYLFGICALIFGILHFVYADYVATLISVWIPAHLFFAYFTGAAHFAGGLAILTRVLAPLATTMLGIMYASWVLILHIPRVIAAPQNRAEWTSLFVATALSGSAWIVAGGLARKSPAR